MKVVTQSSVAILLADKILAYITAKRDSKKEECRKTLEAAKVKSKLGGFIIFGLIPTKIIPSRQRTPEEVEGYLNSNWRVSPDYETKWEFGIPHGYEWDLFRHAENWKDILSWDKDRCEKIITSAAIGDKIILEDEDIEMIRNYGSHGVVNLEEIWAQVSAKTDSDFYTELKKIESGKY